MAGPTSTQRKSRASRPAPRRRPTRAQIRRRRITVAVLALAVIVLTAVGAYKLVGALRGGSGAATPKPSASVAAEPSSAAQWAALDEDERYAAQEGIETPTCPADSLALAAEATARSGGGFTIGAEVTNNFPIPCLITATAADLSVTITSGDETVWTSASCPKDPTPLLIEPEGTAQPSMEWAGNHRTSGCEASAGADPGVYKANVTVNGASATVTFEVR